MVLVETSEDQEKESFLKEVPDVLRTKQYPTVGLVKSTGLLKLELRSNVQLSNQRQYPLSPQARERIKPTTIGLLAGPCNTPIFSVKKPNS